MTIKREEEKTVFSGNHVRNIIKNGEINNLEAQMVGRYEPDNIFVFTEGDYSICLEHSSCEDEMLVREAENALIGLIG